MNVECMNVYLAVPQVKRNLEAMLFKVKALTEAMGCLGKLSSIDI
jgi:hypothetical protein